MTIEGWIYFGVLAIFSIAIGIICSYNFFITKRKNLSILSCIIAVISALILYFGFNWYYTQTESGKRELVDQQSEINGGLDRTINIYTADGELLATYNGKIDIENKDGGYLLFDFKGKRYTYYNCFVESIADIRWKEI